MDKYKSYNLNSYDLASYGVENCQLSFLTGEADTLSLRLLFDVLNEETLQTLEAWFGCDIKLMPKHNTGIGSIALPRDDSLFKFLLFAIMFGKRDAFAVEIFSERKKCVPHEFLVFESYEDWLELKDEHPDLFVNVVDEDYNVTKKAFYEYRTHYHTR